MLVATAAGVAVVALSACGSSQAAPRPVAARSTAAIPATTTTTTVAPPATTTPGGGGATTGADPAGAAVQPGTITGNNGGLVFDCSTTSRLLLTGNHNSVTLTGTCEQLSITGDANTVRVADVGAIDLTGDANHVTWGAGQPQVRDTGQSNVVAHGSVPARPTATTAPVVPGTVPAAGTFACSNRTVTISGSAKAVTLTGTCAAVSITGDHDTVHIAAVGAITVTGSDDKVIWLSGPSGDSPTVHSSGTGNTISHG
jgi:hypothetical protein